MRTDIDAVDRVVAALSNLRIVAPVRSEHDLQSEVARYLDARGIRHRREHVLGPRNRIDFLTSDGIGIELKKGKPNSVRLADQVRRYAEHDEVRAVVIVVERNIIQHEREANGKPVRYVGLARHWGVAV